MDYSSYYDVALNDLKYLNYCIDGIDHMPEYNNVMIQEQQVCEKLLKHLVRLYVFDADVDKLLKSHKLITLVNRIEKSTGRQLEVDKDALRYLSDFYFDGRYPGVDFIVATRKDAEKGYDIVNQVKAQVDNVVKNYKPTMKAVHLFD